MWLLLAIVLNGAGVDYVEILKVENSEARCNVERERALSHNPPSTMYLGCIQLKGVTSAKTKELPKGVRYLPRETNSD